MSDLITPEYLVSDKIWDYVDSWFNSEINAPNESN